MTKQQLEQKLESLRTKWRGRVPKNNSDPNWWAFKCDRCIAIGLKTQIENFKTEEDKAEDLESMVKQIFT